MSQITELKRILLEEDRHAIDELRDRVAKPSTRAEDVAEVLPAAISNSHQNNPAFVESLRAPVDQCVHDSIHRNPDRFADALFPVIGPAIRKAVAESIRALAERINQTLEQAVSMRGVKWRIESVRTGVPVSDLIVRDTLAFQAEQIFVIHRDSGLLVSYLVRQGVDLDDDSDAVSAMLTAIQDFVRDSFGGDEQGDLDTVQIGGHTVWIDYGPQAMLAVVFSGNPPSTIRSEFHQVNEAIHREYGDELETFDGDRDPYPLIEPMVSPLFNLKVHESNKSRPSLGPLIVGCTVIALLFLGWWAYQKRQISLVDQYAAKLNATPGVVVLSRVKGDSSMQLRVLKDPLAKIDSGALAQIGLEIADVEIVEMPYISGEPEIVLARVKQAIDAPTSVNFEWREGDIVASGYASATWIRHASTHTPYWIGMRSLDLSAVESNETALVAQIRKRYSVPESVDLEVLGDRVVASGEADVAWLLNFLDGPAQEEGFPVAIDALRPSLASVPAYLKKHASEEDAFAFAMSSDSIKIYGNASTATIQTIDTLKARFGWHESINRTKLFALDVPEFRALLEKYNEVTIIFSQAASPTPESARTLIDMEAGFSRLVELAKENPNLGFTCTVTAYADHTGSSAENVRMRKLRQGSMAAWLISRGVESTQIIARAGETPVEFADDRSWRRVVLVLERSK